MQSPSNESLSLNSCSTLVDSTAPNPLTDVSIPVNIETSVVAMKSAIDESVAQIEGNVAADESVAQVGGSVATVAAVEVSFPTVLAVESSVATVAAAEGSFPTVLAVESSVATVAAAEGSFPTVLAFEGSFPTVLAVESSVATVAAAEGSFPTVSAVEGSITTAAASEGFVATAAAAEGIVTTAAAAEGIVTTVAAAENSFHTVASVESSIATQELITKANVTVSKDGTGNFKTVNEAVAAAPANSQTRFTIYVKKGIYDEIVKIGNNKTNITIVGDGSKLTVLTGNIHYIPNKIRTYDTATLAVDGDGFMVQRIGIRNTAGPVNGPAAALRVSADRSVIYQCSIDGYQDTLYAHSKRQYYRECFITGTVDFIFGHASAVFQMCDIVARKPGGDTTVITAQSRSKTSKDSAFTIQHCKIRASEDLRRETVKSYLGRPWDVLSRVVIMQSYIGDFIDPAGWLPWNNEKERLSTLFYAEYDNNGPGADTSRRVTWEGYKILKDPKDVASFTVGQLLQGDSWLKTTGVPYESGL